ncbi:MAG: nucleotide pyrophosphohydrolase [Clostridia bacterium]|nr:nucleotide pyrophosphohydrolase [Clostridia bacterium]
MSDLGFNQMQAIQKELQDKYKNIWAPLCPKLGREQLLWMMIEAGEVADIIKKQGDEAIMNDPEIRNKLIEEMCDVMMYFNDVLLCYDISVEDLREIYLKKHERNMKRWVAGDDAYERK